MSKTTKKRFMMKRLDTEIVLPGEKELVAKVIASRGRDLHEVEDEHGHSYLASMPTRFRKSVWVRRGQFVYLLPIEEGDKVRAEIQHVLDEETVQSVLEQGRWPDAFLDDARRLVRPSRDPNPIDADMLPPSESEDEAEDDESATDDADSGASDDEDEPAQSTVFNPNRAVAP